MLFLLFEIGDDTCALATDRVIEVVPLRELRKLRQAPAGVAGLLDYRGGFIPVVDIYTLELNRPARQRLSTRIAVVRVAAGGVGSIGLMMENATETLRLDPAEFAPFAKGPRGLVQRVEVENLVPPALLAELSGPMVGA
jgi:chemotaxis-related protein WspB